jgi:hypothetical protein
MSFITRLATCPTALQSRPFSQEKRTPKPKPELCCRKGENAYSIWGVSPRYSRPSPFAAVIVCHTVQSYSTCCCCRTRASFLLLAQAWCEKRGPVKTRWTFCLSLVLSVDGLLRQFVPKRIASIFHILIFHPWPYPITMMTTTTTTPQPPG